MRKFTVATLFALLLSLPTLASAQRAVLTKSIDEPGRTPYQSSLTLASCTLANFGCDFHFKPVPAGQRLVITYVSAYFTTTGGGFLELYGSEPANSNQFIAPPPYNGIAQTYVVAASLMYFVEPGDTPTLRLGYPSGNYQAQASITGYLVDIP